MFEAAAVGSLLAGGPVVAILGMVYNVIILGPTGFLGSAVFILFYPAMVSTFADQALPGSLEETRGFLSWGLVDITKVSVIGWEIFSQHVPSLKSPELDGTQSMWTEF